MSRRGGQAQTVSHQSRTENGGQPFTPLVRGRPGRPMSSKSSRAAGPRAATDGVAAPSSAARVALPPARQGRPAPRRHRYRAADRGQPEDYDRVAPEPRLLLHAAARLLRTTAALLALFSVIDLWANELFKRQKCKPRSAAWYTNTVLTFSDAIAVVRRELWLHQISFMSRPSQDSIEYRNRI